MGSGAGHAGDAVKVGVDVAALESLGRDVIATIGTARELLSNQRTVLAEYHKALRAYRDGLATERERLDRHEIERFTQIERSEAEAMERVAERERLCESRERVAAEVQQPRLRAVEEKPEEPPAAPKAATPASEEQRSRDALSRFQKMCRDAKRKSIGAG